MLVIPNAGSTTGGNKYASLDQAEPDALDFEIIGNTGRSGVLRGCVVTSNNSSANVTVESGVVVVSGEPFSVPATLSLALPTAPDNTRFDLIVARVSGQTASLVVVQGENSSTNPTFPSSTSVITGGFAPSTNIDLNTDVVLAAVFRSESSVVTEARIVDKRAMLTSSIYNQGTSDPLSSSGSHAGELFFDTSDPDGPSSGVWVKRSSGQWTELARNVGPQMPIGSVIAWPARGTAPEGCMDADGRSLAVDAYPALFAVYGYDHGGSGGTFNIPNWTGRALKGTTNPAAIGTFVGSDTVSLSSGQIPQHRHSMSHTHSYAHSHGMGSHNHSMSHQHTQRYHTHTTTRSWDRLTTPQSGSGVFRILFDQNELTGVMYARTRTESDLVQTFSARSSIDYYSGSTGSKDPGSTNSQNSTTTGPPSTSQTGYQGSGSPVSVVQASAYTRWIVRATMGSDASSVGSVSPYEHIFTKDRQVDNPSVGSTFLWVAPFDCRVDTVRAYRDGGTALGINITTSSGDALVTDLPTADGVWTSAPAAGDVEVAENSVVEIEVTSVSGSPSSVIVQVDFSS